MKLEDLKPKYDKLQKKMEQKYNMQKRYVLFSNKFRLKRGYYGKPEN